jgi:AhpD family alkylhydroperoxidase
MEPRLDIYKASSDALKVMPAFSAGTEKLGLEKPLLELVKLRASQINGCAFCVDMHAADARKGGETERRA